MKILFGVTSVATLALMLNGAAWAAGTLYTSPIVTDPGGSLTCQAVNLGAHTRTVDIRIFDSASASVGANVCTSIAKFATCTASGSSATLTAPFRCEIHVTGTKRAIRGTLIATTAAGTPDIVVEAH